jgi:hypothetical protein
LYESFYFAENTCKCWEGVGNLVATPKQKSETLQS